MIVHFLVHVTCLWSKLKFPILHSWWFLRHFSLFFFPYSCLSFTLLLSSDLGHAFHAWGFNLGFLIYIFLTFHHEPFFDLVISILFLLSLSVISILIWGGKNTLLSIQFLLPQHAIRGLIVPGTQYAPMGLIIVGLPKEFQKK